MTSSRMSQTCGSSFSTIFFACLILFALPVAVSSFITNGLNSSIAISLGRPRRFWRKRPCLPFSISESDFSALLPGPVTARPRLPLSISASTASWSILFSFLTMISGAPRSRSLRRRLFLLMILLYRSLRSDVANLPPSSCTIGLISGGITGITFMIIHSGLFSDVLNASITSSLLMILVRFWPLHVSSSFLSSALSASRSIALRSFCIASAPISATNEP